MRVISSNDEKTFKIEFGHDPETYELQINKELPETLDKKLENLLNTLRNNTTGKHKHTIEVLRYFCDYVPENISVQYMECK